MLASAVGVGVKLKGRVVKEEEFSEQLLQRKKTSLLPMWTILLDSQTVICSIGCTLYTVGNGCVVVQERGKEKKIIDIKDMS